MLPDALTKEPGDTGKAGLPPRLLLGARRVDAADLDRFAVWMRMVGSLGDVVETAVRLSQWKSVGGVRESPDCCL